MSSSQNFWFLAEPALLLAGDAVAAEAYADSDPDAAMAKARRFSETLTKMLMRRAGLDPHNFRNHFTRIEALAQAAVIPEHVRQPELNPRTPKNSGRKPRVSNICSVPRATLGAMATMQ